ncbi:uncharacterized protein [Hyperolius riggenbachi]|uniref:uncharacterized protein n=1 Tax=Hyperolius riggenbachi TaxID=752182 RepID=UPI0035A2990C
MKPSASFVAILGAFIALIELGFSLPPIGSSRVSCFSGGVYAGVHYSIKKGVPISSLGCVPGILCNVSVSVSDTMRMKLAISCCAKGNQCTLSVPPLPEEDSKFDGLQCHTCRTGPYGLCKNTGLLEMSECETIKEPCMMVERLTIDYKSSYSFLSYCGTNSTGNFRGNDTSVRSMDEPFRQCIKISCNRTSAADTASKSVTSLQNSFLLAVICLLLLEAGL